MRRFQRVKSSRHSGAGRADFGASPDAESDESVAQKIFTISVRDLLDFAYAGAKIPAILKCPRGSGVAL